MPAVTEAAVLPIETFVNLVQRLSQVSSESEITGTVTRAIRRLTDADGATFVLKEGESCYYTDEDTAAPAWIGSRFPLPQRIHGWAMAHSHTVVLDDVHGDGHVPPPCSAQRPGFLRSLVMVPVRTDGPIAAIGAYWSRPKQPSPSDVAMLEAIAHAATLAIKNLDLVNSLKAAAETKARLLTAVSHDLRQPLQSLSLFAGFLEGEAGSPAAQKAATQIAIAVDRMANMLGSILALADLNGDLVAVKRSTIGVDALLAPLVAELQPQAEAKDIALRYVASSAKVYTDPGLITAILRNLMTNSIRYTESGRVLAGARRHGDEILLVVADSGIGIEADKQAMIFEEFYQVGNQARDFSSGTGVGLAIVQRLIHILGHRIGVRSIEGRGSLFTVALPAA